MTNSLKDKTILITGACGVLGKAYIEEFLNNGAKVIASDINDTKAVSLRKDYAENKNFHYYTLNVGDEEEVEKIFKKIKSNGLKPNVVLNNAAITGEFLLKKKRDFQICKYNHFRLGKNVENEPYWPIFDS